MGFRENIFEKVEKIIDFKLKSDVKLIQKMSDHHLNSGGKRLRALLTLGSAKLSGYVLGDRDVNLSACVWPGGRMVARIRQSSRERRAAGQWLGEPAELLSCLTIQRDVPVAGVAPATANHCVGHLAEESLGDAVVGVVGTVDVAAEPHP